MAMAESLESRRMMSVDGVELDRGFGAGGTVEVRVQGRFASLGRSFTMADGRVLLGGQLGGHGLIVRVLPDGTRDRSFGDDGVVTVPRIDNVETIAVDRDGKVLAGGGFARTGRVVRLHPDGRVDRGFHLSGLARPFGTESTVEEVVPLADGSLLAAGRVGGASFGVAKYKPDGKPDRAFGVDGRAKVRFGSLFGGGSPGSPRNFGGLLQDATVDAEGRILLGGSAAARDDATGDTRYGAVVARLSADGRPAPFGARGDGILWTAADRGLYTLVGAIVPAARGGAFTVVGGRPGDEPALFVTRYRGNGRIDGTFGVGGSVRRDVSGDTLVAARGLADGSIVFASGETDGTPHVWVGSVRADGSVGFLRRLSTGFLRSPEVTEDGVLVSGFARTTRGDMFGAVRRFAFD